MTQIIAKSASLRFKVVVSSDHFHVSVDMSLSLKVVLIPSLAAFAHGAVFE